MTWFKSKNAKDYTETPIFTDLHFTAVTLKGRT